MDGDTSVAPAPNDAGSANGAAGRPSDAGRESGHPARGPACVLESRVYRGPNPYGYRPVIRLKLALGELEHYPTDRLPGFTDRPLDLMPGLQQHGCSYGE